MRKVWLTEDLELEAIKYDTRGQFMKKSLGAYKAAIRRDILDEICSHMVHVNKTWSLEDLRKEALKYTSKIEFKKNSNSAYQTAYRRGILDIICSHIIIFNKKWTYNDLLAEALKYKTRGEFQKESSSAYATSVQRGILNKICSHMPKHVDQSGENNSRFYWTIEKLQEEALKYDYRPEFKKCSSAAYACAERRKLLNTICVHMHHGYDSSMAERELAGIINAVQQKSTKLRDRKVKIKGKPHIKGFDIDIYIPELMKGIEFDGKWYHSIEGLRLNRKHWPIEDIRNYHHLKDNWFKSQGIKILHIKEKDWIKNRQKCINKCLKFLGVK